MIRPAWRRARRAAFGATRWSCLLLARWFTAEARALLVAGRWSSARARAAAGSPRFQAWLVTSRVAGAGVQRVLLPAADAALRVAAWADDGLTGGGMLAHVDAEIRRMDEAARRRRAAPPAEGQP